MRTMHPSNVMSRFSGGGAGRVASGYQAVSVKRSPEGGLAFAAAAPWLPGAARKPFLDGFSLRDSTPPGRGKISRVGDLSDLKNICLLGSSLYILN